MLFEVQPNLVTRHVVHHRESLWLWYLSPVPRSTQVLSISSNVCIFLKNQIVTLTCKHIFMTQKKLDEHITIRSKL